MYCPAKVTESQSVRKVRKRIIKKQKKRSDQRLAKQKYEKGPCLTSAMSSWAEHFTAAATWQLKHQLAYWKAKAISLQYENNILHEVIQRNHIAVPTTSNSNRIVSDSEFGYSVPEHSDITTEDFETQENDTDYTESESETDDSENEGEDFEVSEEFIQFLTENAKYKEDAKRERERLKAKLEAESQAQVPGAQESVEDKIAQKKELYGDKYQKIVALEMYQMCNLKNESDKLKATYWPNIPLNLNSS